MQRLIFATLNSVRAFRLLIRHEAAFRQEIILFVLAIPAGWYLSGGWRGYGLLLASLILLIIVEVLNTAIEATCNALSREFNRDIQIAKDCGSLAVACAIVLAAGVWGLALWDKMAGSPF